MSLDVCLTGDVVECECWCDRCGHQHSRQHREVLFSSNITHNLGSMAREAGIYMHLWRPEEIGITRARELVKPLQDGLELLEADQRRFKKFNSPNGWGMYEHFVPWVREYLQACRRFPDALVEAMR